MIGRLRGTLIEKRPPRLLLDVHGVGYEVEATMTAFYGMPEVGAEYTLYTHLVVREDAHTLFGFAGLAERDLFRELIRVNGVGPRMALTILSGMSAGEFAAAIGEGDPSVLTRLPGVGKKTAERLIIEMRDRLNLDQTATTFGAAPKAMPGDPASDAVSALVALGYKPAEAGRLIKGLEGQGLSSEEMIRQALRSMVK
ncbi:MAG: Holliday junction branch migration protein RuvA [Gammaproteobacteria bacterium]|nr:Holliday junction branch migration protein RuvA [Gammaproteobacteria bacterium]